MTNTHSAGSTPTGPQSMATNELVKHYIELWKKTVEVQQHFNDLEWRIRGLALTSATFALGASGLAAKQGSSYHGLSVGTCILLVGLILWYGFYFADRYWYHSLLIGSVKQGSKLEEEIRRWLPDAGGLTDAISAASPEPRSKLLFWAPHNKTSNKMHSTDKLNVFYIIGAVALGLTAIVLQLPAFMPNERESRVERVVEVIKPTGTNGQPIELPSATVTTAAPRPPNTTTIRPPTPSVTK